MGPLGLSPGTPKSPKGFASSAAPREPHQGPQDQQRLLLIGKNKIRICVALDAPQHFDYNLDLINVCQVYAVKHDTVYNTTKTECMVVSTARTQTTKLLVVGNTLQRKFSYCSREVKMELFRSHCYSIYCNSLWSRFRVATLNRLKVCHNDILKRFLGLPRWCSSSLAFARNGVNNRDVIRQHSVFSLKSRVELSTNSIITSVRQSSAYVCGPIQQRWLDLLFVHNVG
ncbi:hypothetical protein GWK47_042893 [Chionoecetes opilio]|uniref:Uncharacterized protein n=1 Tax=Chionoecetes opilio TaxID=41210 RepID=A0A8J5CZX1_CHIOP|nr:hypothetical protein GWK47_042893 [Chionoecetes opilio]